MLANTHPWATNSLMYAHLQFCIAVSTLQLHVFTTAWACVLCAHKSLIVWCSNIEGPLDSPLRIFRLLRPRQSERILRPLEVWKIDLHTSDYMRNVVGLTMEGDHASKAMAIWLHVLHSHLSTLADNPAPAYLLPWRAACTSLHCSPEVHPPVWLLHVLTLSCLPHTQCSMLTVCIPQADESCAFCSAMDIQWVGHCCDWQGPGMQPC